MVMNIHTITLYEFNLYSLKHTRPVHELHTHNSGGIEDSRPGDK